MQGARRHNLSTSSSASAARQGAYPSRCAAARRPGHGPDAGGPLVRKHVIVLAAASAKSGGSCLHHRRARSAPKARRLTSGSVPSASVVQAASARPAVRVLGPDCRRGHRRLGAAPEEPSDGASLGRPVSDTVTITHADSENQTQSSGGWKAMKVLWQTTN